MENVDEGGGQRRRPPKIGPRVRALLDLVPARAESLLTSLDHDDKVLIAYGMSVSNITEVPDPAVREEHRMLRQNYGQSFSPRFGCRCGICLQEFSRKWHESRNVAIINRFVMETIPELCPGLKEKDDVREQEPEDDVGEQEPGQEQVKKTKKKNKKKNIEDKERSARAFFCPLLVIITALALFNIVRLFW